MANFDFLLVAAVIMPSQKSKPNWNMGICDGNRFHDLNYWYYSPLGTTTTESIALAIKFEKSTFRREPDHVMKRKTKKRAFTNLLVFRLCLSARLRWYLLKSFALGVAVASFTIALNKPSPSPAVSFWANFVGIDWNAINGFSSASAGVMELVFRTHFKQSRRGEWQC